MYIKEKDSGIARLSFNGVYISMIVTTIMVIIESYIFKFVKNKIITNDEKKKAIEPSSVFPWIFIEPNFVPMIAAKLSEILIIRSAAIAIS